VDTSPYQFRARARDTISTRLHKVIIARSKFSPAGPLQARETALERTDGRANMWHRPGLFRARAHSGWRPGPSGARSDLAAAAVAVATGESVPKVAVNLSPRGTPTEEDPEVGTPVASPAAQHPDRARAARRDRNAARTSVMIWLISECHPLIGIYELDCREGEDSPPGPTRDDRASLLLRHPPLACSISLSCSVSCSSFGIPLVRSYSYACLIQISHPWRDITPLPVSLSGLRPPRVSSRGMSTCTRCTLASRKSCVVCMCKKFCNLSPRAS